MRPTTAKQHGSVGRLQQAPATHSAPSSALPQTSVQTHSHHAHTSASGEVTVTQRGGEFTLLGGLLRIEVPPNLLGGGGANSGAPNKSAKSARVSVSVLPAGNGFLPSSQSGAGAGAQEPATGLPGPGSGSSPSGHAGRTRLALAPQLAPFERLVSELYSISAPRLAGLAPPPPPAPENNAPGASSMTGPPIASTPSLIRFSFAILPGFRLNSSTECLKLLVKWKGRDAWENLPDAQFDLSSNRVTLQLACLAAPSALLCAVCQPRRECFEITNNGCLHASRLNHAVTVRIPRGAAGFSTQCAFRILHVWPDQLDAARQERAPEMNEVPEQCVSDFYEWTLLDPSAAQPQTALSATVGGAVNTNPNPNAVNTSAEPSAVLPIEQLPLSQTMHTNTMGANAQEQQGPACPGQSHALPLDRAYPFEFRRPIQFKVPVPDWFRESEHAPENLGVLYRVVRRAGEASRGGGNGGAEQWELVEPSTVKYNKVFLAFECRYLTRFCVCLAKDTARMVRLRSVMPIIEDFCSSVPAELLVFLRVPTPSTSSTTTAEPGKQRDWELVVVRTRNEAQREKARSARIADGFAVLERRAVALGNGHGPMRKESSETDVGEERVVRKRSRKSVQFALPQVPLRVPISWPVLNVSLVGDACAVKERERSTPPISEDGPSPSLVANKPANQSASRWQMGVWEEFSDGVLDAHLRPAPEVESRVRELLQREQDRLTRAAFAAAGLPPPDTHNNDNENPDGGQEQLLSQRKSSRVAFEASSDSSEEQRKERNEREPDSVLDLNAIEFRAQLVINAPPMSPPISSLNSTPSSENGKGFDSKQKAEALQTAVYDVSFSLHQVRELLGLPVPEAPKIEPPAAAESEAREENGAGNEKAAKPSNAARDELLRRIESQAGELLRRGSKDVTAAAAEERRDSLKDAQAPLLALRQKQAQRTAQLSRPRPLYASLAANTFTKEPKILSGRSLQALSKYIERGLTLGVHLNLKDSVISGIAFDSLSKRSALNEVTYRVLLQWKRTAGPQLGPRASLTSAPINGGLLNPARTTRSDALAYQLMDALHAMELHGLATAVSYAFVNDLELSEVNVSEFLCRPSPSPLPGLPLQAQQTSATQMPGGGGSVANGLGSGVGPNFGVGFGVVGNARNGTTVPPSDRHVTFEQLVVLN